MEAKDEFQFKPINEGLGFHKKKPILNLEDNSETQLDKTQPHQVFQQEEKNRSFMTDTDIHLDSEIDKKTFNEPSIGQQDDIFGRSIPPYPSHKAYSSSSAQVSVDTPPLTWSQPVPQQPTEDQLSPTTAQIKKQVVPKEKVVQQSTQHTAPHLGAYMLDLFVIIGLAHILLVPLLLITQLQPFYILQNATDPALQISLLILLLSVLNFYLMTSRSCFGATLGEWSCDITLGDIPKQQSPIYPILVAWRCFVMTVTGVVTLPFLGWISRTDLLGKLSFVRLMSSR